MYGRTNAEDLNNSATVTPDDSESALSVWDELDAAYQAGYDEGYKEGVNAAYDQ